MSVSPKRPHISSRFGDFARFDRQRRTCKFSSKIIATIRFRRSYCCRFLKARQSTFLWSRPNKPNTIVQGKIVRSGYARHSQEAMQRYGQRYAMAQSAMAYQSGGMSQPIIEVDGKLRFALPGQPLFPPLGDDTILKPTIEWQLQADKAGKLDAELAYVTGGMSWEADYNIVAPEKSDLLDFVGWVTMDNQSGKTFENAKIKLMAGDVSKIQQAEGVAFDRNEELGRCALPRWRLL